MIKLLVSYFLFSNNKLIIMAGRFDRSVLKKKPFRSRDRSPITILDDLWPRLLYIYGTI